MLPVSMVGLRFGVESEIGCGRSASWLSESDGGLELVCSPRG